MSRKLSQKGARFIGQHEGLRLNLYNDPANHCTIGYGHLVHSGPCSGTESGFANGISRRRALQLLMSDAGSAERAVNSMVNVPLNQDQFDALVSFVFNVGAGNFQRSALLRQLNAGNYNAVPNELRRWVHGGGRVLPGLVTRREEEAKLWGLPPRPRTGQHIYRIVRGDTLTAIAARFGTTVAALAEANNLPDPNLIRADRTLIIPHVPGQSGTTPDRDRQTTSHTYTVVGGDTLSAIAARFGTTVAALVRANHIANPDLILIGQALKIP